jgi:hypothetical protein
MGEMKMRKTTIKALAIIATILWAGMVGTPLLYGEGNFKWNRTTGLREQAWTVSPAIWMPTVPFMSYGQERPKAPSNFDDWNGIGMVRPLEIFSIINGKFNCVRKNWQIDKFNRSDYNRFKKTYKSLSKTELLLLEAKLK